jgi:cystathionine beta-synthase
VVFIVCDTGEHYLTKFHSDEWLKEKLLLEPQRVTARLIIDTKNADSPRQLLSVAPAATIGEALKYMDDNRVTQLPVLEDGQSVGSLKESRAMAALLQNRDLMDSPVSEIMDKSFPVVDVDISLEKIVSKLRNSPAVLVEDFKRITGIITRADVLDFPTSR